MYRPISIDINLEAIRKNFFLIRKKLSPNVKIMATVKQAAYGHGLIPVARELSFVGVDCFCVGSLEEAIELRKASFTQPILILSPIFKEYLDLAVEYHITPTVVDYLSAKIISQKAKSLRINAPIQINIDTGMGRLGPYYKDADILIREIYALPNIRLEGIYTHFPVADTNPEFTHNQIIIFKKFISLLENEGIQFIYKHCANSSATLDYLDPEFNMVRPGIILYGIKPFKEFMYDLHPALSLKSKIIFTKEVPAGMGISYGHTFVSKEKSSIATLAAGYADGYPWHLSYQDKAMSRVIIKNEYFPVVGRVCMDHLMVDVGERHDITVGEEATLIGSSGVKKITVEELAQSAKTIPYEITSRLSLAIPRFYHNSIFSGKKEEISTTSFFK